MRNENGEIVQNNRNILEEISLVVKKRIAKRKEACSLETIKNQAKAMKPGEFLFEKALRTTDMAFICEVKKASPSKGVIAPEFPYLDIAKDYEKAGATAISCLTEAEYFQGDDRYLAEIVQTVKIPVLRKDFFVDPYMVYEAKILGASCILLICALLSDQELQEYFAIANELGLSAIFEAHDEMEVERAVNCGARIIGVNNRNLKTFQMNLENSIQLRAGVPSDILFISESGITKAEDIRTLADHGIHAVLIGETLMRATDKKAMVDQLRRLL